MLMQSQYRPFPAFSQVFKEGGFWTWSCLLPRVEFGVGLFQIGYREAQVALCGGQGAVPQEVLDVAQIGVVLNEMGSTSVAPHMRGHDLLDPGRLSMLFYQGAEGVGIQRIAPV